MSRAIFSSWEGWPLDGTELDPVEGMGELRRRVGTWGAGEDLGGRGGGGREEELLNGSADLSPLGGICGPTEISDEMAKVGEDGPWIVGGWWEPIDRGGITGADPDASFRLKAGLFRPDDVGAAMGPFLGRLEKIKILKYAAWPPRLPEL